MSDSVVEISTDDGRVIQINRDYLLSLIESNTDPNHITVPYNNENFQLPLNILPHLMAASIASSDEKETKVEVKEEDETIATALISSKEIVLPNGEQRYIIAPSGTTVTAIKDNEQNRNILTVYSENFVQEHYFDDVLNVIQANTDNSNSGSDEIVYQAVQQQQQLPIVPALTNETNAVMPIMSTLEQPTKTDRLSPHSSLELGVQNLDESLAVIGVTAHTNIPTSLELPITITNPAIAPKSSANSILSPIYALANGSVIGLTASSAATSPLVTSISDTDNLEYDFFDDTHPASEQLLNENVDESHSNSMSPPSNSIDLDSNSDIIPVTPEPINHRQSPEIRGFPSAADINDIDISDDDSNSSNEIPLQSNLVIRHHHQHQQEQQQQQQQSQSSHHQQRQQNRRRNNHFIIAEIDDDDEQDDEDDTNTNFVNDHHHHQYMVDEQTLGNATFSDTFNR